MTISIISNSISISFSIIAMIIIIIISINVIIDIIIITFKVIIRIVISMIKRKRAPRLPPGSRRYDLYRRITPNLPTNIIPTKIA